MKEAFRKVDGLFRQVIRLEKLIGIILLFIMLVICFAAVIKRYFFNSPWVWSDEIQMILIVIFGYICISIDVYRDQHVALTILYNKLSPGGKKVLDLIRHVVIGGFCLLMTRYGWQVYQIKARKNLAATGLSQGIVFMAQVVCGALMVLFCLCNIWRALVDSPAEVTENKEGEEGK